MQKKRLPILRKVSNLLKTSMFIAKMRKPIIAKLILLKKSRTLNRFKLSKHHNYTFLEEYQFSASSTPLIHYRRRQLIKKKNFKNISSMLFLCRCFGGLKAEGAEAAEDHDSSWALETVVPAAVITGEVVEDEDDSVDQRAERFIEWFYQEMRMQRQDPI